MILFRNRNKFKKEEITAMEEKIYDMVIIGAGPAGMSAAVYAKRAEFSVLVRFCKRWTDCKNL